MTGPVVEWARRWLGITQLQAENRRLTAEVRTLRLDLEQLHRNVTAAEKVAQRATYTTDGDTIARIFSILRRGSR
jgi:cell division protein FtsB